MYDAHAFGRRYKLPIPLLLFIGGGTAIIVDVIAVVIAHRHLGRRATTVGRPGSANTRGWSRWSPTPCCHG